MSAVEKKPFSRAIDSNVSLTNVSTRSPSGCLTRCWNASAKIGSMPEEQPAIIEIVPVGAIVVTVELRIGRTSL
jgi:hypothetical protein